MGKSWGLAPALAPAFALGLCACSPLGIGLSSTAAGAFAYAKLVTTDANDLLAADAPLKAELCRLEKPDEKKQPRFLAWCDNIPTNVLGLAHQWAMVGVAGILAGGQNGK